MVTRKKQSKTSSRRASKKTGRVSAKKAAQLAKQQTELDTTYFLKIVVFLVLGSQWIFIERAAEWQMPIPVGFILGLVFATHEHFEIDRKIEYVILIMAAFISFWLPLGLVIQV
jgi:hypothetical protein